MKTTLSAVCRHVIKFCVGRQCVAENIVAEALTKSGRSLYYWKRDVSSLEMDFFVRDESSIIPVEVKGGNDTAQSLRKLIRSAKYPGITWGIKLADANIGFESSILTMPWFCAFLLDEMLGGHDAPMSLKWFEPPETGS